jgi:hypothetical protein
MDFFESCGWMDRKLTSGPEGRWILMMDVRAEARTYPTVELVVSRPANAAKIKVVKAE